MREQRCQEGYVCLHATNAEFHEGTKHLPSSDLVSRAMTGAFDQHGIVMRSDDRACEPIPSVQANTITTSGPINLDLARVRRETVSRVFCGYSALNGEPADRYTVLG